MAYHSGNYNKSRSTQKSILKKSYNEHKPPSGDSIELVKNQNTPREEEFDGTLILEDTRF